MNKYLESQNTHMRKCGFPELINARRVLSKPLIELSLRNEQRLFYDLSRRLKRFYGHTALAYYIIPDVERGKFRREKCSARAANLRDYIEHKGNRNVSITTSTMAGLPDVKYRKNASASRSYIALEKKIEKILKVK